MPRVRVALLVCLTPVSVLAQPVPPSRESRFLGGLSAVLGAPTGHFGQVVGSAGGIDGHFTATSGGPLGLRLEAAYLEYASETTRVPIDGASRASGDRTIDNGIERLAVGPVVMQRRGHLRPYAYATVGTSWFVTRTRVTAECDSSCDQDQQVRVIAEQTNGTGSTLSWSVGGGILLPAGGHGSIDVGIRYVGNGTVSWLGEGDLVEDTSGRLQPHPRRSPANVVELTLGYTFGH
jgi:opacity protein-like surface antigen